MNGGKHSNRLSEIGVWLGVERSGGGFGSLGYLQSFVELALRIKCLSELRLGEHRPRVVRADVGGELGDGFS